MESPESDKQRTPAPYRCRGVVSSKKLPSVRQGKGSCGQQADSPVKISEAMFRHRKGGIYSVLDVCIIEKTCEPGVVYQDAATLLKWCRPISEFLDGRFTPLGGIAQEKVKGLEEYARRMPELLAGGL